MKIQHIRTRKIFDAELIDCKNNLKPDTKKNKDSPTGYSKGELKEKKRIEKNGDGTDLEIISTGLVIPENCYLVTQFDNVQFTISLQEKESEYIEL